MTQFTSKIGLAVLVSTLLGASALAAEKKAPARKSPTPSPAYKAVVHSPAVSGQAGDRALGLMLGEPTGISGKYFIDSRDAIDAGLTYSFSSFFMVFGDYLRHWDATHWLESTDFTRRLKLYLGAGAGFKFSTKDDFERRRDKDDSFEVFVRVPLGAEWRPADPPIGVFLEIGPGMKVIPGISGMFFGAIGARLYF